MGAVDANLSKKGLKKVDSDPDVFVTYFADDEQQTVVNTTHHGYGYGAGWYWGGGMGMGTSTTHVSNYTKGTLVVDIYKAQEKQLIWRGSVSDDPQKNVKKFTKGLAKLFEKYPPLPTQSLNLMRGPARTPSQILGTSFKNQVKRCLCGTSELTKTRLQRYLSYSCLTCLSAQRHSTFLTECGWSTDRCRE